MNLQQELADAMGLHPESIQLDDLLAVAERYGRVRAAEELRAAVKDPQFPGDYLTDVWLNDRAAVLDSGSVS